MTEDDNVLTPSHATIDLSDEFTKTGVYCRHHDEWSRLEYHDHELKPQCCRAAEEAIEV